MTTSHLVPKDIHDTWEVHEWRNAAGVLKTAKPDEWNDVMGALRAFRFNTEEVVEDSGEAARLFRDDGARASDMMPPGGPPPRWPVFFVALGLCRRQSSNLV